VEGGVMDIVERLQGMSMMKAMTWVTADKSKRPANIYSEAADEIERLREEIKRLRLAVYDIDRLPVDLRSFYQSIR
jgi:hypothetical protein